MGFFGNLIKSVGRLIGSAAETLGKITRNDKLENWGADLKAQCQFGSSRWNSSSSVEKTVDTHRELERVKNSVESQARAVENEMIVECTDQVKDTIDSILPLVSNLALRMLNEDYAEQIQAELSDEIMTYINPRLSMDDYRCTAVLNILDDHERMEACRKYQNGVMADAVKSFKKDCIRVKDRYILEILDLAEAGLREQEQECKRLERMLKDRQEEKMDETQIDIARARILVDVEKLSLLQAVNNQAYTNSIPQKHLEVCAITNQPKSIKADGTPAGTSFLGRTGVSQHPGSSLDGRQNVTQTT